MPASAPTGERYAPMFEPMIEAYVAPIRDLPARADEEMMSENSTLMGILLKIFDARNDVKPYTKTLSP